MHIAIPPSGLYCECRYAEVQIRVTRCEPRASG
jgi:hypothetical protein